jgi:hypothetical protein
LTTIYIFVLFLAKPNIIRVVKSRTTGWAVYVASMGKKKYSFRILICQPEEKRPLGTAGVYVGE